MKVSHILGLNARSRLFSYQYNKARGKSIANSKIRTKRILKKEGIAVPEIYAKFIKPQDIIDFDWQSLPSSFALKPNKGLGGEGIIVVRKRAKDLDNPSKKIKDVWITTQRKKVTIDDLLLHCMDILEGAYSVRNVPDIAFIEEFIGRHKSLKKYAYRGLPDIRVVVFNKVPVMAMLRLPTKPKGRANLHQGAIAVGIDIATGITTKAYWNGKFIVHKPGTKRKLHGIKIPYWTEVLKMAVQCQEITDLGYLGADIILHPEKGPMVLELNPYPGLQIQLANMAGLRKRLDRVEDLEVRDAEHGVKIAKALFMASFADRVKAREGVRTISALEEITIKGALPEKKRKKVIAKVDTGAWRTSISETLAKELGLLEKSNILWTKKVRSSLGQEERPVISLTYWLAGRKIVTPASVAKRMALKYPVLIGRKNLKGILVDPHLTKEKRNQKEK